MDREDPRRYESITRQRLEDPASVQRAASLRRKHAGPVLGRQNFIIAADHPAQIGRAHV